MNFLLLGHNLFGFVPSSQDKKLIVSLDFYTWTRDSALTFKALVEAFIAGNSSLEPEIQSYIYAQVQLQAVSNPSGELSNGAGLGEPKFEIDGTKFTGDWGRPQRDGPALRAITLIAYSTWLIANGKTSTVASVIWPVVSNDLNYVAQYWNQSTFDIWEETDGMYIFRAKSCYHGVLDRFSTHETSAGGKRCQYLFELFIAQVLAVTEQS